MFRNFWEILVEEPLAELWYKSFVKKVIWYVKITNDGILINVRKKLLENWSQSELKIYGIPLLFNPKFSHNITKRKSLHTKKSENTRSNISN